MEWWKSFFDAEYVRLWSELTPPTRSEQEAEGLWSLLKLERGSRVLDAPAASAACRGSWRSEVLACSAWIFLVIC